jgi:predicted porin
VSYASPNMSGFQIRTQYAFIGEGTSGSCAGWDTAVRYVAGPVRVGATYARHSDFAGLSGTSSTTIPASGIAPGITAKHDQDAIRFYGSFDAGFARFDATYETARYKPAAGSLKYKYWEIGALAPLGASTFGVQYSQRDKGLAALYNPATRSLGVPTLTLTSANFPVVDAIWDRGGGKHLSFTHDYALSKRTTVRSYYTTLENENTAVLSSAGALSFAGKTRIRVFSMGLWHSF